MKILGKMQPIEPGSVDVAVNDCMGIFIPKAPFDLTDMEHVRKGYEFVISFGPNAPYKVENRYVITEHNKIFPFNPEQSHQAVGDSFGYNLLAFFLDTDYLQGLADSIYWARELSFYNRSFAYDAHLKNLLLTFIEESRNKQGGHDLITQSIANQVGVYLLRNIKNNCPVAKEERYYSQRHSINQAIEFLYEDCQNDFSLNEVAQVAHLSPYHFSRVFKAETGKTPFKFLSESPFPFNFAGIVEN
ncbi:MAG: helix-turn-helix transcriptional regulator [Actinobacteria bacterium]|nr:helix-turn-helix transcriptional regulator [Actinomycetota bacterium]